MALADRSSTETVARAASAAKVAVIALWITVGVASVSAVAEVWRYLLLYSREGALSALPLLLSDALVITSGLLLYVAGAVAGGCALLWLVRARAVVAQRAGVRNARPDWLVITGTVVPGWNLFMPGSALAELEHTLLAEQGARQSGERPRPSILVRLWWLTWVVSLLLGWTGVFWNFRDSVQAQADGVLLHAWIAVAAAVTAFTTLRVIGYLLRLLAPLDPSELKRARVIRVRGAAPLVRTPRPSSAPR